MSTTLSSEPPLASIAVQMCCGKIGTVGHLPALKELQDQGLVQVTACDADPAKAKAADAQFGFPTVTDWESAAADVDAVSVCLPPGPNAEPGE